MGKSKIVDLLTLATLVIGGPISAECFDAPMWRGEPLTQAYIAQEAEAGADAFRVAHLRLIAAYPNQMAGRRADALRRIIPQVLMQYDGDKVTVGRELRSGNIAPLLDIVDIESLPIRGGYYAERLLWYNGCAREAVGRLAEDDNLFPWIGGMIFAFADADMLQNAAAQFQDAAERYDNASLLYPALRYRTFAAMLENPEAAVAHMEAYLAELEGNLDEGVRLEDTFDWAAVRYAIAGLTDAAPSGFPQPPAERSGPYWDLYLRQVAEFPVWAALSGQCARAEPFIWPLMSEIGSEPAGWELQVQAVAILCASQAASPG